MYSERPSVTRFKILKFLVSKVPMVLFAGVKPIRITYSECAVSIKRNWRNRNPHDTTYFAAVETAAEMAAGLMLFDDILTCNRAGYSMGAAIMETNTVYRRPVTGKGAIVICRDGMTISESVSKAHNRRLVDITTVSEVLDPTNDNAKPMAITTIRWRIIRHKERAK